MVRSRTTDVIRADKSLIERVKKIKEDFGLQFDSEATRVLSRQMNQMERELKRLKRGDKEIIL